MFCKNCGKQIEEGANNCQYCGAPVTNATDNNTLNTNNSVEGNANNGLNTNLNTSNELNSNLNTGLNTNLNTGMNQPSDTTGNITFNNPTNDTTQQVNSSMNNNVFNTNLNTNNGMNNNMQQNTISQNGKNNNMFIIIVVVLGVIIVGLIAMVVYKNFGGSNNTNNGNTTDIIDDKKDDNNTNKDNSNYYLYKNVNYYIPTGWTYAADKTMLMLTNSTSSPAWVLGELIGYDDFESYKNEETVNIVNALGCTNASSYKETTIANRDALSFYFTGCNGVSAYETKIVKVSTYKVYVILIFYYDDQKVDSYVEEIVSKTLSYNSFSANDDKNDTDSSLKDLITKENISSLINK